VFLEMGRRHEDEKPADNLRPSYQQSLNKRVQIAKKLVRIVIPTETIPY
jgi:hypothetical protein